MNTKELKLLARLLIALLILVSVFTVVAISRYKAMERAIAISIADRAEMRERGARFEKTDACLVRLHPECE